MPVWEAVLLGVVQGLTEFLPISSTAHLLVVRAWLGHSHPEDAFTVVIQLGRDPDGEVIGDCMLRREDAWAQVEVRDQALPGTRRAARYDEEVLTRRPWQTPR